MCQQGTTTGRKTFISESIVLTTAREVWGFIISWTASEPEMVPLAGCGARKRLIIPRQVPCIQCAPSFPQMERLVALRTYGPERFERD